MKCLLMVLLAACCGCTARSMPSQNLYVYTESDILRHLRDHGFPADNFCGVGKSRDGERVIVREMQGGKEGAFWLLDAAHETPQRLDWPIYRRVWLDANAEIAAWTDSLGTDGLHLRGGLTVHLPEPAEYVKFKMSQYADFFYIQDRSSGFTKVYKTSHPEKLAFVLFSPWDGYPDDIYTYGDEIYLQTYGNLRKANCFVYAPGPDGYAKRRETSIPGRIRDVDPRSGLLLISTSSDLPMIGFMQLFDEKTGQKTYVGYALNTVEMFLARDFLSSRLK